ncbi:MAG: YeaH/YhbH family protein [Betaproteobacteria bacterium]|nr:YeaH/YhbH family protein [Betaproteobacteria bacterium]
MADIIDRRENPRHKSAINQQRFLRRYRAQVREAVAHAIAGRKIAEADRDASISIPARDLNEPVFSHGVGGRRQIILPGNREYVTGDAIQRPQGRGGGAGGSGASDDAEGEDSFRFRLSREEFLDFFFEDMALPDLVKTQLTAIPHQRRVRAGYRTDGTPSSLAVVRTMRESLARRIAFAGPALARLREVDEALEALGGEDADADDPRVAELLREREALRAKVSRVPFIDTFDLRYRNRITQPLPIAQAVMFCVMDVSGSMDESRKDLAKRFFILLHLFLKRHYDRIEIVFIRHHTAAKVVDEEEFFHSTESGGTRVSSALEMTIDVIKENFPRDRWNIYVAQASDGDNIESDSPHCRDLLLAELLPMVQYMAYVEITTGEPQNLWVHYEQARAARPNLALGRIRDRGDIYPVLRELFAKKDKERTAA